jgi:hypothetical protein
MRVPRVLRHTPRMTSNQGHISMNDGLMSLVDDARIVDVRGRRSDDVEMKCVSKRTRVGQARHLIGGMLRSIDAEMFI